MSAEISDINPLVSGHWGSEIATEWRAQWIWLPDNVDSDMMLARKVFEISQIPEQTLLSISASSNYKLFINDQYVCSGPARCAPHHQSYDVFDIAKALWIGLNSIAVRVHHQREDVSFYGTSHAGLLVQIDFDSMQIITDDSWRVLPDSSWEKASPRIARFHLEASNRTDLRSKIKGWAIFDYDDREWLPAKVLQRNEGWPMPQENDRPTHLTPPWILLVPRDIPYLTESIIKAKQKSELGAVDYPAVFDADLWLDAPVVSRIDVRRKKTVVEFPISISDESKLLVFDLGEVHNGRPYLDIKGAAGTVVDIMSKPFLVDGSMQSQLLESNTVDRIVLSGERERWEAFYSKPTRWLAVIVRHLPGNAVLHEAGVVRSDYPFEQKGSFSAPDFPELEKLWNAAAKTIRVCTTDAYTDNYRERRQYAQTSYYACLGNYSVFGDTALQRRYLMQIAGEQLANGMMPAYAPRHGNDFMVILDSNCFWLRGLHQYLLYSGDQKTVRELLPAARKLLDCLHGFTNKDGLIDSPPYPYWLDHALIDRHGANFCLNGHYLGALENFSQLLDWVGEPDAEVYRQQSAKMRGSMREDFWDDDQQLFSDALINGVLSDLCGEHANAMALALKITDPEQAKSIAEQLKQPGDQKFIRRESGTVIVTPAMSFYLHAGLCEAGFADESWKLLWSRFQHMLTPESSGTLWEEWWLDGTGRCGKFEKNKIGRSDAQTESAFPPALFTRYILGIEPTKPGLSEVVLRYYQSSRLHRREGAIPTPSGLLKVAWDISSAEFKITLQIPPDINVILDLASLGMPSQDSILVNNVPALAGQLKQGQLLLQAGNSILRIKR